MKFWRFLQRGASGWSLFFYLFIVWAVCFAYGVFSEKFVLLVLKGDLYILYGQSFLAYIRKINILVFIFFNATMEEFLFRCLPVFIALHSKKNQARHLVAWGIFSSFFMFSFAHGSVLNMCIQGLVGIVWFLLYLKCGGLQGNHLKAVIATGTVHGFYNLSLITTGYLFPNFFK